MRHFDPQRRDFSPYGFTCELWEPETMPRPDRHDEIEINFLDRGTLTYLLGGQRVVIQPRSVTIFWAAVPHQIVAFEDVTFYYVITVPFGWVLHWGLPENLLSALLHGHIVADRGGASGEIDPPLFEQWHRDLEADSAANREVVMLELQARLLRLALRYPGSDEDSVSADSSASRPHTNLEKAEAMASFVARNYTSRLRVEDIAACSGLNADYAATLFRKVFGMTLTELIARHRIAHAQRQLVTTDDQIVQIAHDSGFDSLSRFNRAFKQLSGMTPREFRKTNGIWSALRGTVKRR
jgi:AraC family transcriptional regulator, melibiose operon regulatory protein